ncbi:hypothetical protein PG987_007069 [Apiospora arundinis]
MYFVQSFFKTALLASLAFNTLAAPVINNGDAVTELEIRGWPHRSKTPPNSPPNSPAKSPPIKGGKKEIPPGTHPQLKRGKPLFYSGPNSYAKLARDAIKDTKNRPYLQGYSVLADMFVDKTWADDWNNDFAKNDILWDVCSQALAEISTGTVYVILPRNEDKSNGGTTWHAGTRWDRFEWPHIPAGVKVIRINPEDPKQQDQIKG